MLGFLKEEVGKVRDYVVYVCIGTNESGLQELELEAGFLDAEFESILGFGGPVEPEQGGWGEAGLGCLIQGVVVKFGN